MKANIAKYRKRKDLTLRELAKLAGISFSRLCEYEHGEVIPSPMLYKLANILDIPTGDLFLEEDLPTREGVATHAD